MRSLNERKICGLLPRVINAHDCVICSALMNTFIHKNDILIFDSYMMIRGFDSHSRNSAGEPDPMPLLLS